MIRKYARIQNGLVAELLTTDGDIVAMFNAAIVWADVSSEPGITEGWTFDGMNFASPPTPPAAPSAPSVIELQARIAVLAAQLAALSD